MQHNTKKDVEIKQKERIFDLIQLNKKKSEWKNRRTKWKSNKNANCAANVKIFKTNKPSEPIDVDWINQRSGENGQ